MRRERTIVEKALASKALVSSKCPRASANVPISVPATRCEWNAIRENAPKSERNENHIPAIAVYDEHLYNEICNKTIKITNMSVRNKQMHANIYIYLNFCNFSLFFLLVCPILIAFSLVSFSICRRYEHSDAKLCCPSRQKYNVTVSGRKWTFAGKYVEMANNNNDCTLFKWHTTCAQS